MALDNLNGLKTELIQKFEQQFSGHEISLPDSFKRNVETIFTDTVSYQKYTLLITTNGGLKIFMPNQWVYIASYFTPFYKLLLEYKAIVTEIFSSDRIKALKTGSMTEEDNQLIINKGYREDLENISNFLTQYSWWGGGKTIDRGDFYVSPILNMAKAVNASTEYIATLCEFLSDKPDLAQNLITEAGNYANKINNQVIQVDNLDGKTLNYLTAIRTKPFLLLAGISGTGKSRLVRELAFMSCPNTGRLQENTTTPGNYCMIEVKSNWHDSSELLGYTSGLQGKYIVTPFVKFLVKAMRYPEVPFFVCLDEMNLAPVEQYFAEYLSVLETRSLGNGVVISGSLINRDIFRTYEGDIFNSLGLSESERTNPAEELVKITAIKDELKEFGLRLPQNVIVVGTVNMDDTTHQFSRKVIDRAMTFEMNHLNFTSMFEEEDKLTYTDNPLDAALFISDSVTASQALELIGEEAESVKTKVVALMESLDVVLKDTPFRVAYRVQNELVLYCRNLLFANPGKSIDELFPQAADALLTMKVLPRIEGDEDMVDKPLKALEAWTAENNYTASNAKIKEMLVRLERSHYTSYWP